ncbi:MAG: hypothetical protein U1E14_18065 [Geminicoccaceae bacterium]
MRSALSADLPAAADPGHELRTPLHAIRSAAELLLAGEGGALGAAALPLVAVIAEAARQLEAPLHLLAALAAVEDEREASLDLAGLLADTGFALAATGPPLPVRVRPGGCRTAVQVWHALLCQRQSAPRAELSATTVRLAGPRPVLEWAPWLLASQLMTRSGLVSRIVPTGDCLISLNGDGRGD